MSYKIDPDAKYMTYDKPVESDDLRKSIKNAVDMIINNECIDSMVLPKEVYKFLNDEIEIDNLKDEITEMSACKRTELEGFSISELKTVKEQISQGFWHEYVIRAMRLSKNDIIF